jgi:UDP-N-acetylglucosamine 2-epimerase (non-hydrolysing)
MPEEINRIVTDSIADILWTPSLDGNENLENSGVALDRIEFVGNIMIDSLVVARDEIEKLTVYEKFKCDKEGYGLVTLHRPSNVDDNDVLEALCKRLSSIAEKVPLIFPVHPRTKAKLDEYDLSNYLEKTQSLHLIEPLGYLEFMNLVFNSRLLITDSGGVQEETTFLGIPCLTLRSNTERPVTVTQGTNRLCKPEDLENMVESILNGHFASGSVPDLWDGKTAERVVESIRKISG